MSRIMIVVHLLCGVVSGMLIGQGILLAGFIPATLVALGTLLGMLAFTNWEKDRHDGPGPPRMARPGTRK